MIFCGARCLRALGRGLGDLAHNEGRERWGGERRQEAAQKLLIGQLDRVASRGRLVCGASQTSSTKVLLCA